MNVRKKRWHDLIVAVRSVGKGVLPSLLGMCAVAANAQTTTKTTTNLIANGNFESGTLSGWSVLDSVPGGTTTNPDSRNFYAATPGANTPTTNGNTPFATSSNPTGGSFYAVSNSDFPGQSALYQKFTVLPNTVSIDYSFQMFVNDQSGLGAIVDTTGLDYTTGGAFRDNQHARVDILRGNLANFFSTDAADIVATLYVPSVDAANPAAYTTYSGVLNGLNPGQSYYLRFAEVDNLSALNLGVDNVAIRDTVAPEASPLILMLGGLPILGSIVNRHRIGRLCIKKG